MVALGYGDLRAHFKKGLRNGNWRWLSRDEKALYRAALAYTKPVPVPRQRKLGEIVNRMVVDKLLALIEKLLETRVTRVLKRGYAKARELLEHGDERGVFVWAPSLRSWLRDRDYIFWLGTVQV
ncbi:MAG: hypothetical protein EFT35_10030 [Methanophagales archaeon ANME-1-THS]|nr:MAG: hypothetical protein EFT35_10030 [Methanophagales archaeon ANME-1-THS]